MLQKWLKRLSVVSIEVLSLLVVTAVALGVFGFVSYRSEKAALLANLHQELVVDLDQLVNALALPVWNIDESQIEKTLESFMLHPMFKAIELEAFDRKFTRIRGEDGIIRDAGEFPQGETSLTDRREITYGKNTLGFVHAVATSEDADVHLRSLMMRFASIVLVLEVLLVLSLYFVNWRLVLRPILEIERFSQLVSSEKNPAKPKSRMRYQGELESLWTSIERTVFLLETRYDDAKKAREIAEVADKTKTEFLNIAAHELRTPLTPLALIAERLHEDVSQGQKIDPEMTGIVRRQVARLTELVSDLLDVSRLERGGLILRPKPIDMNEMAKRYFRDMEASPTCSRIRLIQTDHPLRVDGDENKLRQVLDNLIENAVKYTPEGRPIEVRLEALPNEKKARVSVIDHGKGIPEEMISKLFDRFSRLKTPETSSQSGMGLGLYICRRIVELHGGRIAARSEIDRGSTFYFDLPIFSDAGRIERA